MMTHQEFENLNTLQSTAISEDAPLWWRGKHAVIKPLKANEKPLLESRSSTRDDYTPPPRTLLEQREWNILKPEDERREKKGTSIRLDPVTFSVKALPIQSQFKLYEKLDTAGNDTPQARSMDPQSFQCRYQRVLSTHKERIRSTRLITSTSMPAPAPFLRQGGPAEQFLKGAFKMRNAMPTQPSTVATRFNPPVRYRPNFSTGSRAQSVSSWASLKSSGFVRPFSATPSYTSIGSSLISTNQPSSRVRRDLNRAFILQAAPEELGGLDGGPSFNSGISSEGSLLPNIMSMGGGFVSPIKPGSQRLATLETRSTSTNGRNQHRAATAAPRARGGKLGKIDREAEAKAEAKRARLEMDRFDADHGSGSATAGEALHEMSKDQILSFLASHGVRVPTLPRPHAPPEAASGKGKNAKPAKQSAAAGGGSGAGSGFFFKRSAADMQKIDNLPVPEETVPDPPLPPRTSKRIVSGEGNRPGAGEVVVEVLTRLLPRTARQQPSRRGRASASPGSEPKEKKILAPRDYPVTITDEEEPGEEVPCNELAFTGGQGWHGSSFDQLSKSEQTEVLKKWQQRAHAQGTVVRGPPQRQGAGWAKRHLLRLALDFLASPASPAYVPTLKLGAKIRVNTLPEHEDAISLLNHNEKAYKSKQAPIPDMTADMISSAALGTASMISRPSSSGTRLPSSSSSSSRGLRPLIARAAIQKREQQEQYAIVTISPARGVRNKVDAQGDGGDLRGLACGVRVHVALTGMGDGFTLVLDQAFLNHHGIPVPPPPRYIALPKEKPLAAFDRMPQSLHPSMLIGHGAQWPVEETAETAEAPGGSRAAGERPMSAKEREDKQESLDLGLLASMNLTHARMNLYAIRDKQWEGMVRRVQAGGPPPTHPSQKKPKRKKKGQEEVPKKPQQLAVEKAEANAALAADARFMADANTGEWRSFARVLVSRLELRVPPDDGFGPPKMPFLRVTPALLKPSSGLPDDFSFVSSPTQCRENQRKGKVQTQQSLDHDLVGKGTFNVAPSDTKASAAAGRSRGTVTDFFNM